MKYEKIFLGNNFLSGFLICIFGISMAAVTGLTRGIYPLAVFVLMVFIGTLLMMGTIRGDYGNLLERISWKEILLILLLFINPILAERLGFYFSAYLVIAGVSWLIEPEKNRKVLVRVMIYSLLVTVFSYIVFTLFLKIITPTGILR